MDLLQYQSNIGKYKSIGYVVEHIFEGEYALMMRNGWEDKVRVYEDGSLWEMDSHTGEYIKTERK